MINTTSEKIGVNQTESEILKALLYFNIFKYPLNISEIKNLLLPGLNCEDGLLSLERKGMISGTNGCFFLGNDSSIVERRLKGNELASGKLAEARKMSKRIGQFPFVRGVMVSGSLSKGYMDEKSDIDFFVVTHPGRLWLSRTFLILYKKIFLLNSRKKFCVNYFIDTEHLDVPDKNIFTAVEVTHLIPCYNEEVYKKFMELNEWTKKYFPAMPMRDITHCHPGKVSGMKWFFEKIFSGKFGNRVEAFCIRRTVKRWKKKFSDFSEEKFNLAMRSKPYVSKHHPSDFQTKVLTKYSAQIQEFEKQWGIQLNHGNG